MARLASGRGREVICCIARVRLHHRRVPNEELSHLRAEMLGRGYCIAMVLYETKPWASEDSRMHGMRSNWGDDQFYQCQMVAGAVAGR